LNVRMMELAAHEAWQGWLALRPWDLFLTLTSERRTAPEALQKRFLYVVRNVTAELYGRRVMRKGSPIEWVNGIERHKSGWPHSHGLLRFPGVDVSNRVEFSLKYWQEYISGTGGWAWLSIPRSQGDTVRYVTKYVTKDGELVLSDNLSPAVDRTPPLWRH